MKSTENNIKSKSEIPIFDIAWLHGLPEKNAALKTRTICSRTFGIALKGVLFYTIPLLFTYDLIATNDLLIRMLLGDDASMPVVRIVMTLLCVLLATVPLVYVAEVIMNIVAKYTGVWLILPAGGFTSPDAQYHIAYKLNAYGLRHNILIQNLMLVLFWSIPLAWGRSGLA